MLTLVIEGQEMWDESTESFRKDDGETLILNLEHSLISLSKWESKFEKSFLGKQEKSVEEIIAYIEAMIVDEKQPKGIIEKLTQTHISEINSYIDSKQSATYFSELERKSGRNEPITSELIYYWMIAFNIPFECQTWHLNRLFALIRICNMKNAKPEKMSKHAVAQRNRELNDARKKQLGTSG